jgi:hypothetical protein
MSDCDLLSWPFIAEALADSQCKLWNPDNAPVVADQSFFAMTCSAPFSHVQVIGSVRIPGKDFKV